MIDHTPKLFSTQIGPYITPRIRMPQSHTRLFAPSIGVLVKTLPSHITLIIGPVNLNNKHAQKMRQKTRHAGFQKVGGPYVDHGMLESLSCPNIWTQYSQYTTILSCPKCGPQDTTILIIAQRVQSTNMVQSMVSVVVISLWFG